MHRQLIDYNAVIMVKYIVLKNPNNPYFTGSFAMPGQRGGIRGSGGSLNAGDYKPTVFLGGKDRSLKAL